MEISPTTLEGKHVRLEPLSLAHEKSLIAAAADGELWNSTVTIVPTEETMAAYIETALKAQSQGHELPFVIIRKSSGQVVGTTRFYEIQTNDRRVAIGYTWLAAGAQRTAVNTEAKLLLLAHAFERWGCIRVELITDVLNQQSRAAILRLGAKQEGVLRSHMIMPDGRRRDSACFSIIESYRPEVKATLEARLGQTKSPTETRALPVACALTAPELQERRQTVLQKVRRAVQAVTELEDGYAYSFPLSGEWLRELAGMIDLERQCCPFLRFRLTVEESNCMLLLEMTGPEGTKEFLVSTFESV
jgi:RimJ/RimL family protein N-acetyltransferase